MSADNQQETFNFMLKGSSETTRETLSVEIYQAYLQGALHDGTFIKRNQRFRFCQLGTAWLEVLKFCLHSTGYHSWIYREGRTRKVYVLETLANFLNIQCDPLTLKTFAERKSYIRGFFDAEGGIPKNPNSLFYIQLVQKNQLKLEKIKQILYEIGIITGKIHNPSVVVDPEYYRMYVLSGSRSKFIQEIGTWHPRKLETLLRRKDDDIVHALWRHREYMNKASVAEAVDGSPPF
jgi:hypothetical protein